MKKWVVFLFALILAIVAEAGMVWLSNTHDNGRGGFGFSFAGNIVQTWHAPGNALLGKSEFQGDKAKQFVELVGVLQFLALFYVGGILVRATFAKNR